MTSPLEYAPPQKWFQRRRFRRLIVWLLILAALSIFAWLYGPKIYNQCSMLYWQRQCTNYTNTPPIPNPTTGVLPPIPWPDALTKFFEFAPSPTALFSLPPYNIGTAPSAYYYSTPVSMSFRSMHTLHRAGERRLVVISQEGTFGADGHLGNRFVTAVFKPGTLTTDPEALSATENNLSHFGYIGGYGAPRFGLIADLATAQIDPADNSSLLLPTRLHMFDPKAAPIYKNPRLRLRLSADLASVEPSLEETP